MRASSLTLHAAALIALLDVAAAQAGVYNGGVTGPCTDFNELSERLPPLNIACCGGPGEDCSSGVPSFCDEECAAVLRPFMSVVRPRSDCLIQLEC